MTEWPYPYGSDLHHLWGWGKRVRDWSDREPFTAGESDWIIFRDSVQAADALLVFGVEFPLLMNEIRMAQRDVEARWEEALDNDDCLGRYAESLDDLARVIFKSCELVNGKAEVANLANHLELFPKGDLGDKELTGAIEYLAAHRRDGVTDIDLLRKYVAETDYATSTAKNLQDRIRKARNDGRTSLPKRK